MSELVRLSVNLNQETAAALRKFADSKGITLTEAVRRCVGIADYIQSESEAKRRLITEEKDGTKRREMVLM